MRATYKLTRERNTNRKKTPYVILRYLPLTHRLQRLYASEVTTEHMTWHANHQTEEGSICHPSDVENGRKSCYSDCHRQFLHEDIHQNKKAFTKNQVEKKVAHPRLIGEEIRNWVAEFSPAVEVPLTLPPGYSSDYNSTKKNIFWELNYWGTHLILYNIDVMHIEKNVFDNIFNTVMDIIEKRRAI
ncbi:hypothetical protein Sango_2758500 [Sesamum angolense]|uniref:Uncharacterized protein n=1 Tax=Sesamum angolense TaxID=2727404 RepID=A0AAE1VYJ1_9LAMI|nr:hypothetical protein Sango_2758500 [Sesamum angolense]